MKKLLLFSLCLLVALVLSPVVEAQTVIKQYPLNSVNDIITKGDYITLDKAVTKDGNGALKITAKPPMVINDSKPLVIHLFNTGALNIEDATLVYQAKVKTENFKGIAFLEMWCQIPNKGKFFSRDLATPVVNNTDWKTETTPFLLQKGQKPGNVEIYLIIKGYGTVWIDDVELLKKPLPAK